MYDMREIDEITPVHTKPNSEHKPRKLDLDLPNHRTGGIANILDDKAAALAAGFTLAETMYTEGTAVNEIGVENAGGSRRKHDSLPSLGDAMHGLSEKIKAEHRRNTLMELKQLILSESFALLPRVAPGAAVRVSKRGSYQLANTAYLQLTEFLGIPTTTARWLRSDTVSAGSAVRLLNEQIEKSNKTVLVRGRVDAAGDKREVFAVVGEKYPTLDANEVCGVLSKVPLLDHAKGDVAYSRSSTKVMIDASFHSDVVADFYACGELFRAGIRVGLSDSGNGSYRVSAYVVRNLCLNLIILDEAVIEFDRIIHAGSVDSRRERITTAVTKASDAISYFAAKWENANKNVLAPRDGVVKVKGKKHVIEDEVVTWAKADPHQRVVGLLNGYSQLGLLPHLSGAHLDGIADAYFADEVTGREENPITLAGVVNGITRYAHTSGMGRWSADALERAAGTLTWRAHVQPVYQHVNITR